MIAQTPWVIVDTGTLLTLLLGGEGRTGLGYSPLLLELAEKKLVHLVIPDMVVSEFLGLDKTALYKDDFIGKHAFIDVDKNVPYGFAKPAERVKFIKKMLTNTNAEIMQTACGDEYLSRLQGLMHYNVTLQRRKDRDKEWPLKIENLRVILADPRNSIYKAVKQDSLIDATGNTVSSGKQDRGELAAADCIRTIQEREGRDAKCFVLFEGSDVRGRVIQRLLSEKGSDDYWQLHGKVRDWYNPNSGSFNRSAAAGLGDINFLSTKAFLAGFMKAAKELSVAERIKGMASWYILSPEESKKNWHLNEGYRELMQQVQSHGLGRAYDKYRDRPIADLKREDEDEYAMVNGTPQNAPWMKQMTQWIADEHDKEVLREIVHQFVNRRQRAMVRECEDSLENIIRIIPKMMPETASMLLISLTEQMGRAATAVREVWRRAG